MKISEFEQALRHDPKTSNWLKEQLEETLKRDVLDALNDAEALKMAIKNRINLLSNEALRKDPSTSYWLKHQLEVILERDLNEAYNDAEALFIALKARFNMSIEEFAQLGSNFNVS